jgi:hypothetical protein
MPNSTPVLDLDTVMSLMAQTMSAHSPDQYKNVHCLLATHTYFSVMPSLIAPPYSPSIALGGLHMPATPVSMTTTVVTTTPSPTMFAAPLTPSLDLLKLHTTSRPQETLFHGTSHLQDLLHPFHFHAVPATFQSVQCIQHNSGLFVQPSGHLWTSGPVPPFGCPINLTFG